MRLEVLSHTGIEIGSLSPQMSLNGIRWVQALSRFEQIDPSIIVPGHGSLGQVEIARAVREYFADVQARVRKMSRGEGIETLIGELKPQLLTTYSTWEHDRFIDPAIRYFAQA